MACALLMGGGDEAGLRWEAVHLAPAHVEALLRHQVQMMMTYPPGALEEALVSLQMVRGVSGWMSEPLVQADLLCHWQVEGLLKSNKLKGRSESSELDGDCVGDEAVSAVPLASRWLLKSNKLTERLNSSDLDGDCVGDKAESTVSD